MNEDEIEEVEEIEPEKVEKKKHAYGLPEWLKNPDYPAIPSEVAEAIGMEVEEQPQVPLDKALIKLLVRRKNAMIILKFLYDRNDAFYTHEIADALGMQDTTALYNLKKLEEAQAGLVRHKKYSNLDKMTVYWYVVNRKNAEIVLKQYYWQVSFNLGHYIPYQKVRAKEVKEDERFAEKAKYYGLSVDEAIDIVKKCPHVEVVYDRQITFLSRNCQGYIPPPKPEEKAIPIEKYVEEVEQVDIEGEAEQLE